MAKIEVTPITSGYNVAALNETLQNIENEFKNKVVYRDEVAPMERALDMNGEDILNVDSIVAQQIQVGNAVITEGEFATDSSAFLRGDLSSVGGASLVGSDDGASGSLWTNVAGFIARAEGERQDVNVLRYIPPNEWSNILSGSATSSVTVYVQAAANAALIQGRTLYFPCGKYNLFTPVVINNAAKAQWSNLSWEGEDFVTGNALYQNNVSGVQAGVVLVTDGNTALQIDMDNFFNESIRVKRMSFFNKGASGITSAVVVRKSVVGYPRGHQFKELGFLGFDTCIALVGLNPDLNDNYFGPTTVHENFAYNCNAGVYIDNAYVNLFEVAGSLYHGCTKHGIQIAANAGAAMTVRNTHFEGCEPSAILPGAFTTLLNLDNVSAEATGTVSGRGLLGQSPSINSLTVNVSGNVYNGSGFALMPDEYRIGRGAKINASVSVKASGYGWTTDTPDMVTPVVSNNAAYNQIDKSTFCATPMHDTAARTGARVFQKFAGWNSGSNLSITPPASGKLPECVRSKFVGTDAGVDLILNITDTFTAPSAGYLYASWIADIPGVDNGFTLNSQVVVSGDNKVTQGNTFKAYAGNFLLLVPMASGAVLGRVGLNLYQAPTWTTGVYCTFEKSLLSMRQAACGYPKNVTNTYTVGSGSTLQIADYNNGATPFSMKVTLAFNEGALGFREYLITGDGAVATNRLYTLTANATVSGVTVTPNSGNNAQLYNIDILNSSGADIRVTQQIEYLS